jgi:hypothetical protein
MRTRSAAAALLLLAAAARAQPAAESRGPRPEAVSAEYFGADWAAVPEGAAPSPAPLPAPAPGEAFDGPLSAEHDQVAHMYITRMAYEIYMSRYPDSDLARYIGEYSGDRPKRRDDGNVVAGSYDEDEAHYNPFDEAMPSNRHFWNWRGGLYAGLGGFDSNVDRAHKYWTGGYGAEGAYDESWSGNKSARRGAKGQGCVYLYAHGDKAKAFWYLGHVAHLLEDLTVPAHVHLFMHVVPWMDAYETYMKTAHVRWPVDVTKPIAERESLLDLFLATAQVTEQFDAGNGGGFSGGVDGTADRGRRRSGGFTKAKLDEEGNVLMPLAFNNVASLFRLFYTQVDHTPPAVRMTFPDARSASAAPSVGGPVLTLSASARDEESGTDREGFLFYSSYWTEAGWTPWAPLSPRPGLGRLTAAAAPGRLYRFKATARDAAGNVGESAPAFLRTRPVRDERRTDLEVRRPGPRAGRSAAGG